jgi:hypothetical protein
MKINRQKGIFFFLITFSIYCALNLGLTWDEDFLIYTQGKRTADYLFSIGKINQDIFRGEYYSPIYYTIKYILINVFPISFRVEASYLINLFFSFLVIIGVKKLCELFFNKDVGKIVFLVLFFYPAFFGHMAFNSKDTLIAFCHIWIFYFLVDYIKKGNHDQKSINNFYLIALLAAVGSGINMFFLGSIIPIILIVLLDIFYTKKIVNKKFINKNFIFHILKSFFLFYFFLILFWIDTHSNIIKLPIELFIEWAFGDLWRGYPFMLFNGNHYVFTEIPKSYLFLNVLFRSPEYFLLSYILFFAIFISSSFFNKNFANFNYKLLLILVMILNPFIITGFLPFSISDGLRHVLWFLPYLSIIPALTIYYLLKNIDFFMIKVVSGIMVFFFIFFLFNFFKLTPYQYIYLNTLNGDKRNFVNKFENDYWGSSLPELIKKINFNKKDKFTYSVCGLNRSIVEIYLKKEGFSNSVMESPDKSDYMIMVNRGILKKDKGKYESENVTNCFKKYSGEDMFKVQRNNIDLSVIRKIR